MNPVPQFTMREMFEASVHMGHKAMFWNPLMAPYIHGENNTIHIIDLKQSFILLHSALQTVYNCVLKGGRILFVSTKHQAVDVVREEAERCGQYYVVKRWLGGMFTNWVTIQATIKNLEKKRAILTDPEAKIIKKERIQLQRKIAKMDEYFSGITDMGQLPDMIFVIDVVREHLAVAEAMKVGIPIVAVLDTNADPRGISYPIPGNDDSVRAIKFYCRIMADTILQGIHDSLNRGHTSSNQELDVETNAAESDSGNYSNSDSNQKQ